jgi:outer membrane protein TolC
MIEQILFRPGATAARNRFAALNRTADIELRRAEQATAIEALRAFYALESAQAQATVAQEGAQLAQNQLEMTKTLLEAGTVSDRDLKASEADAAEAELGRSCAEGGVALARGNLNRVLGREPAAQVAISTDQDTWTLPNVLSAATTEALKRRVEIRLLDDNIDAARAGVSLAGAQNGPSLSARAIGTAQTPTALTDSHFFAAGLALKWSPFDQGKTRADVREARARLSQLEALKEDAILGIKLDVSKAWQEAQTARERIDVAKRQVASAEAAYDVSRIRYEAGSATQLEVSGSLFGLVKARSNHAQSQSDLRLALAEQRYGLGLAVPEERKP